VAPSTLDQRQDHLSPQRVPLARFTLPPHGGADRRPNNPEQRQSKRARLSHLHDQWPVNDDASLKSDASAPLRSPSLLLICTEDMPSLERIFGCAY
jgi:hypothetical protein